MPGSCTPSLRVAQTSRDEHLRPVPANETMTKLVMSVVAPLVIVRGPWITTQGFVLEMERTLRNKLSNLSNGRSDAESLYLGI